MSGNFTNISSAVTTAIATKEATLQKVIINTAVANAVVTIYDNSVVGIGAVDPNGISVSQTPASGPLEAMTITGALASGGVATLGYNRKVTIVTAGDEVGKTFTVTGTNENGDALVEVITATAGPTTDTSVADFLTVTGVVVSVDTAGAVTVGATVASSTPIATITMPATLLQNHAVLEYDAICHHGLVVVTSSTANITVVSA